MTTTKLAENFNKIGIVGRLGSQRVEHSVQRLLQLLSQQSKSYSIEQSLADAMKGLGCTAMSRAELGAWADLIIVVGGDGTFLGAARDFAQFGIPMLGVNRGRVGFLTDIMPDEMEAGILDVLEGRFRMEDRFLLNTKVIRQGQVFAENCALNDVVLHSGQSIRMIEFDLHIDDQFVYSQKSDGLIISTPTGSTAYALSAGGPLVHPSLHAVVLVPMFPHSLNNRPIIVGADAQLCIRIGDKNDQPPHISLDAQNHVTLEHGDELLISKYPTTVRLLHLKNHNYFETCRTKLGWSSRIDKVESESE
ncbi:MAG: NAD(+) kinase [Reinekea sp.]|jgi:NAD+ kinase